jgi:hypothetical protein
MVVSRETNSIVHETSNLRFTRKEVLGCFPPYKSDGGPAYVIPDKTPRQPKAETAWRLLKCMYPDNRVPRMSLEKLAKAAIEFSEKNGNKATIVGRDDIRRALGLKED